MAVSATRWRQDTQSQPQNPNQRLRWYPTYPSGGGGYSTFGWSPMPLEGKTGIYNSPAGFMSAGGLSGVLPGSTTIAKVAGALAGALAGFWLAKRNLE